MGGTSKLISFQGQGHLPLSQAAPSPVQPGLGRCQGSRDSHSCSGYLCQPCPPCQGGIPSFEAFQPGACFGVQHVQVQQQFSAVPWLCVCVPSSPRGGARSLPAQPGMGSWLSLLAQGSPCLLSVLVLRCWHRLHTCVPLLYALLVLKQLSGHCWAGCGLPRVLLGSPDGMDAVPNVAPAPTDRAGQSGLRLLSIQVSPVQICHSGSEHWAY